MFKLAISCLLAIGILIPCVAEARVGNVSLENRTNKSAWITVYWWNGNSYGGLYPQWLILHENDRQKPGCLQPHETRVFDTHGFKEIKLRAEVKSGVNCTGSTIEDTYDQRSNAHIKDYEDFRAVLHDLGNGKYRLWF